MDKISQEQLDGFVPHADFQKAVGSEDHREQEEARRAATTARRHRVVAAADIAELRTDNPAEDGRPYLTDAEARKILPPSYSTRKIGDDVYPALHHPKTTEIYGYLPEDISAAKTAVADLRERLEKARADRAARRAEVWRKIMDGSDDFKMVVSEKYHDRDTGMTTTKTYEI